MASNPPLQMEDTDEDFFDKLVDDDDDYKVDPASSGEKAVLDEENCSKEARNFANLSISDVGPGVRDSGEVGIRAEDDVKACSSVSGDFKDESTVTHVDPGQSLVLPNSNANEELNNGPTGLEEPLESMISGDHGASGVKEVQWSAFAADPVANGGNGFGSYSDFFTDFGDNSVNQMGKGDNLVTTKPNVVSASAVDGSLHGANANDYLHQFQEGQSYATAGEQRTDGQDLNSSQYWENLYPGWRYDANSGQWYEVHEGTDATQNVQGAYESNSAYEWTAPKENSEVSYFQQTAQSSVGAIAEKGTTESVRSWSRVSQASHTNESSSNWNPASQENSGYPSHMVFDPQYPGWYYDMYAQEWRSLDAYNSQQNVRAQDQVNQNGFYAANNYYRNDHEIYGGQGQLDKQSGSEVLGSQGQDYNWNGSFNNIKQQGSTIWQPDTVDKSVSMSYSRDNKLVHNHYGTNFSVNNHLNQQHSYDQGGTASSFNKTSQVHNEFPAISGSQSFVPSGNFGQTFIQSTMEQSETMNAPKAYGNQNQLSYSQQTVQSGQQISYASTAGRSSAGRPPHALVTFGFGGKLLVMKDPTAVVNTSYGSQDSNTGSISVFNLTEVVTRGVDASSSGTGICDYFHTLCRQSFPGPLASGNVGSKELNKWIDERITHCADMDYGKGKVLRLLLSLLKIASQHYGKLRSPFGTDTTSKENDVPEVAVARLFASVRKNSAEYSDYGAFSHCLQQLPSEGQTRATASEVQTLLISGRKIDALHCAQEGQLWGPALVLAAQLGDQFYVDTVKKMALRQLVAGSPLRTLCLLIAGQPADVFSTDTTTDGGVAGAVNMFQQPAQPQLGANSMLDDWEENLAVITANRTKDDELVLIHLGDCLWKETSNIIAAHICYLVAEANFEPYSDSARLCLIGADHWKHPRTYASPEAIQRTEVYEYSKLLGNSQFTLLPFQPYKLIYAHMLAEVGRVSDSLKYCQMVSKSLKTGRAPEVETWRHMVSSLEERIKTHQQGGFSTNLAPGKLVGKLLNLFDTTAHRVVGGLPPPVPSTSGGGGGAHHEHYHQPTGPRVSASQSTMAMSSLMPSASMEPISQRSAEGNSRRIIHNRSVSEPDFGRSPRQDQVDPSKNSTDSPSKSSGTSRFGRFGFGSQLFQKTVGLVLKQRQDKQAKLGETNKFYYDEKLKRWVEEGVDPPAEEAALPPPPTALKSGTPDYTSRNASKSEGSLSNGSQDFTSPLSTGRSSGIPPIPAASNQFSARGRTGVRARYVDTFNKGGGNPTNLFQSPAAPSIKPPAANSSPNFFVPTPVPATEHPIHPSPDTITQQKPTTADETPSFSQVYNSFQPRPRPPSGMGRQRFASMDDMSKGGTPVSSGDPTVVPSRRTASWSGGIDEIIPGGGGGNGGGLRPLGEVLGMPPSAFMPNEGGGSNGGSFGDDLQEVDL